MVQQEPVCTSVLRPHAKWSCCGVAIAPSIAIVAIYAGHQAHGKYTKCLWDRPKNASSV